MHVSLLWATYLLWFRLFLGQLCFEEAVKLYVGTMPYFVVGTAGNKHTHNYQLSDLIYSPIRHFSIFQLAILCYHSNKKLFIEQLILKKSQILLFLMQNQ